MKRIIYAVIVAIEDEGAPEEHVDIMIDRFMDSIREIAIRNGRAKLQVKDMYKLPW